MEELSASRIVCPTPTISTRARIVDDVSPPSRLESLAKGMRRTAMWMSFVQRTQSAMRVGDAAPMAIRSRCLRSSP